MKRLMIIVTLLVIQANLLLAQETKMLGTGVVFAQDEFKDINVLNSTGSLYVKLTQTSGGEIKTTYSQPVQQSVLINSIKSNYPYYALKHDKYKIPLPKLSIRAFYPDASVIVFDAIKVDNGYKIFVNGDWKIIKPTRAIQYQDWATYMKRVYVKANKVHPLYKDCSTKSMIVSDDVENSYKVLEVKGDWIRVQCSQECEGCPDNKILRGWIKWRDKNTIIIDLFYSC
ncbi:hypothetical protein ACFQZI_14840 [Mucilaginibacter lutimaris]|uniref:SH3 domain-containing protein n=1 Tax=Mucilaginibacter lutimaris TaxID=931629 RepID=A0ABW2ZIY6_9SPHI